MPEDDQVIIFRVLPAALAADVFEYLDIDAQQQLLHAMAHEQVVAILNEMSPDDRTALLEELPSAAARQLIQLLTPEERKVAQSLLGYPEGSVGRLMTPDFVAVREHWTVKEVLDYVREHGRDSETLNVIYVVDERGKLIDDLRIREFLLKPLSTKVSDIRDRTFVAVKVNDSQEEALNAFRKYDRAAFRVVRKELLSGVSLGFILGTIGFFRITLWQYLHIFDYGRYHWLVAFTVGAALVGVVLWGTLSGAMLPFLLRRCGLDPAASSAPFVATLVDVTGLVIYFNVALLILRGTLL